MKKQFFEDMKQKGYDAATSEEAYNTLITLINRELCLGDGRCVLQDIGTFRRVLVPGQNRKNPRNPEDIRFHPAHFRVRFRASKSLLKVMPAPNE